MTNLKELKCRLKEARLIRCCSCCKKKDKKEFTKAGRKEEVCVICAELDNY